MQILDEQSIDNNMKNKYDIIINTHGDMDPFYSNSLSKNNAITYCHFPSAKFFIQSEDKTYLEKYLKITRASLSNPNATTIIDKERDSTLDIANFNRKKYLEWVKNTLMIC